jgi:aminopeptidase N
MPTSLGSAVPVLRRAFWLLPALLPLLLPASRPVAAAPEYFPPTRAGWPGEVRDAQDVTHYLSFHKIRAMQRQQAVRTTMTANQAAYDVRRYALDLTASPATRILAGKVEARAVVTAGPLTAMDLDLDSAMVVDEVYAGGVTTTFTRSGDLLTVSLDRAYSSGESMTVGVSYHGTPALGALGRTFAFDTHAGQPLIWTLSAPFGARSWWPCKDYPEDKAESVDLRVTVPAGMVTAGNGRRVSTFELDSVAVTVWQVRYPIATYLVSLASYAYTTWSDWYRPSARDSMEIQFYLFPENVAPTAALNAKVKDMITAYAARFGPYPFLNEKYGEVQFGWGGGMENQTITSLGVFNESIAAHELGHQWWGDMVTCRDFHHVWLNEGFATYCQALWAEAAAGPAACHETMRGLRYFGPGTVYVSDDNDAERVYDEHLSYNKGAWVLHMLRHVLGDSTFFAALRAYGRQYGYGTAVTEDFRDVCAAVSGRNLDRFFQQWIHGERYPQYRVASTSTPAPGGGYDVTTVIEQTQSGQVFWMPVDVSITTEDGTHTFVAMDSLARQAFTFHVAQPPRLVQVDKDEWILRTVGSEPATALALLPARPNPTRSGASSTTLAFSLPSPGAVRLTVVNASGARVKTLEARSLPAGRYERVWDGRDDSGRSLGSGIYIVILEAAGERQAQKVAVIH